MTMVKTSVLLALVFLFLPMSFAFAQDTGETYDGAATGGIAAPEDTPATESSTGATSDTGGSGEAGSTSTTPPQTTSPAPTAPAGTAGTAPTSSGTGFVPLAPIPGLTADVTADQAGLANFLNNLYKYAIGLSAVLAVVMIIWGGLEYATQDVPGAKQNGKERIQQAILGLVLILTPALVFSIINPAILNLSVNLPELNTRSTGPLPGQAHTPQPYTPTSTTSLKNIYAGQLVGFGDNYYPDTTVGAYCFPIEPIARNGREIKYGCSADPNRCLTMSNGSNGRGGAPKSLLAPGTQCTKY